MKHQTRKYKTYTSQEPESLYWVEIIKFRDGKIEIVLLKDVLIKTIIMSNRSLYTSLLRYTVSQKYKLYATFFFLHLYTALLGGNDNILQIH